MREVDQETPPFRKVVALPPVHAFAAVHENRRRDEEQPVPRVEAVPHARDDLREQKLRESRSRTLGSRAVVHVVSQPHPRLDVPVVRDLNESRGALHPHRLDVCRDVPPRFARLLVVPPEPHARRDARRLRPDPAEEVLAPGALAQDVQLPELAPQRPRRPGGVEVGVVDGVHAHHEKVHEAEERRIGDEPQRTRVAAA